MKCIVLLPNWELCSAFFFSSRNKNSLSKSKVLLGPVLEKARWNIRLWFPNVFEEHYIDIVSQIYTKNKDFQICKRIFFFFEIYTKSPKAFKITHGKFEMILEIYITESNYCKMILSWNYKRSKIGFRGYKLNISRLIVTNYHLKRGVWEDLLKSNI